MTKDDDAVTDPIVRLARDLDQTPVRAFIRNEMWQFFRHLGWVTRSRPAAAAPCEDAAGEDAVGGARVRRRQIAGAEGHPRAKRSRAAGPSGSR
jgi:hypothetical protein